MNDLHCSVGPHLPITGSGRDRIFSKDRGETRTADMSPPRKQEHRGRLTEHDGFVLVSPQSMGMEASSPNVSFDKNCTSTLLMKDSPSDALHSTKDCEYCDEELMFYFDMSSCTTKPFVLMPRSALLK